MLTLDVQVPTSLDNRFRANLVGPGFSRSLPDTSFLYGVKEYFREEVLILNRGLRLQYQLGNQHERLRYEYSYDCFFVRFRFTQCNKKYGTREDPCLQAPSPCDRQTHVT